MKITKEHLKAILMEEMESILQERESDAVYTSLIGLFMTSWADPNNIDVDSKKASSALDYTKKKVLDKMPAFLRRITGITGKVLKLKPAVVENAVQMVLDNVKAIEKVFPDPESSVRRMFETKVNIVYDKSKRVGNAAGWFDNENGEVSLNVAHPNYKKAMRLSKAEIDKMPDVEFSILLATNQNALLQVFAHEMTHMINFYRRPEGSARLYAGQANVPAKAIRKAWARALDSAGKVDDGEMSPVVKSAIKYANSTEEMQARLVPIFRDIEQTIMGKKISGDENYSFAMRSAGSKADQREIEKLVDVFGNAILSGIPIPNQTFVDLISVIIKVYDLYYPHQLFVKTDKIRNRLALRAFEFVERLIDEHGERA